MNEVLPAGDSAHSFERDQVVKIINSVISKVEHSGDDSTNLIFKELQDLQKIIEEARAEIGSARPADISEKHIPTATDELDAVVGATAEATGTIMDCCEVIQEKAGEAGEAGNAIMDETMKIFEACSFQDITGQRITKVVKTLKDIEVKVAKLMDILGTQIPGAPDDGSAAAAGEEEDTRSVEEKLLNGPQLPGNAISQDDIDKLLEEFE